MPTKIGDFFVHSRSSLLVLLSLPGADGGKNEQYWHQSAKLSICNGCQSV